MQIPSEITVDIDDRENNPHKFPETLLWYDSRGDSRLMRVHTEVVRLESGDYGVRGYHHLSLAENKGSMKELWSNLVGADSARFHRAFSRMCGCTNDAILWMNIPVADVFKPSKWCPQPSLVLDRLTRLRMNYAVSVVWMPVVSTRTAEQTGELLLRHLWGSIYGQLWLNQKPATRSAT